MCCDRRGGLAPLTPHPCQGHSEAFCGGVAFGQMREGSDLLSSHVIARSSARGVWELTVAIGAGPPAHLNVSSLTSHDAEKGLFQDQSLGTGMAHKVLGAGRSRIQLPRVSTGVHKEQTRGKGCGTRHKTKAEMKRKFLV